MKGQLLLMLALILFPVVAGIVLLAVTNDRVRKAMVIVFSSGIVLGSIYLMVLNFQQGTTFFSLESELVEKIMMGIESFVGLFIIYMGIRYKKYLASLLALLQVGIVVYLELSMGSQIRAEHNLFIDPFSVIMALIIGVIGSLISIYSVGYMKDYHLDHHEIKNRIPYYFCITFIFLASMFGLVFANNLIWLYFFWEITTLCSFLLIGYSKTRTAVNNAFRAIIMNLIGGLGFAIAIYVLVTQAGVVELNKLPGVSQAIVLLPVALLCFAGIAKSAQLPFSSWLLGAMVAPTPTSALLHSSTMVKAGVYLIIRLSPILMGTLVGELVAVIGGFTFLAASCIAISQDESKRVLAYSTVANLGLIVACAGIGTGELVWAAIMLIIFHAVAKALLFLSVGSAEHKIGGRNIEIMDGLITKAPQLAIMMVIGIFGMFLAPFGMLISKWAALEGLIKANPLLVVFVAFGSAATLFFWTKWLGKIVMIKQKTEGFNSKIAWIEINPLYLLAFLTVGVCLLFPVFSSKLILPFLDPIYGFHELISQSNIIIMLMMMVLILILPISLWFFKDIKHTEVYLGGVNASKENYYGAMHFKRELSMRSFYLNNYFGEARLGKLAVVVSVCLNIVMLGVVML